MKGMIENLLNDKGRGFDRVIMENLQKTNAFNSNIIQPNCLTSLFLLDVNKSPKDAFIKIRDEQESYDDRKKKKDILADVLNVENGFGDRELQKKLKRKTDLEKFITCINSNVNFNSVYGNKLFIESLNHVNEKIHDEHFAVQLLAGLSKAKMNAQSDEDVNALLAIEEKCKPFVYNALKKSCPFKTQNDLQNRVMVYFGKNNFVANDYFRQLGIANIIKTKLADKSLINNDYVDANSKNSLIYVDFAGRQKFLINAEHPAVDKNVTKITDLVKKSCLIENGQVTRQSKYISKALDAIKKEVVESYDAKDDQMNFLQTALTFLILMDEENVGDPLDFVGIAIANPVSDILALAQENQKGIEKLIENSQKVANDICKREKGSSLSKNNKTKSTPAPKKTKQDKSNDIEKKPQGKQSQKAKQNKTSKTNENNNADKENEKPEEKIDVTEVPPTPAKPVIEKTEEKPPISAKPVIKKPEEKAPVAKNYISNNVKYYKKLTKKLIETIGKDRDKFVELSNKTKLTKQQKEKLAVLRALYSNVESMNETVEQLKTMHSDMIFLTKNMIDAVKGNKELSIDDANKKQMYLTEEQDILNGERFKIYEAYCTFLKSFDNSRQLKLADFYELKEKNPDHSLNNILKYLPTVKKSVKSRNKEENAQETEKI